MKKKNVAYPINQEFFRLWSRASHDLRQPIQSLVLMTQAMSDTTDPTRRRDTARRMEDALLGLQCMLDDLSRLARLEAGLDQLQVARCRLANIVDKVRDDASDLINSRQISLRCRTAPAVNITTDPRLLETVLTDLILNAVNLATGSNMLLGTRHRDGVVHVEMYFKGNGITSRQREAVFTELHRPGQPMPNIIPGLGIIDQTTRILGGRLYFAASPNGLQRMTVILPARSPSE